jgi:integrase
MPMPDARGTALSIVLGVEHRGIHHMRHAWVTMLAERGVHERVTQQLAAMRMDG